MVVDLRKGLQGMGAKMPSVFLIHAHIFVLGLPSKEKT